MDNQRLRVKMLKILQGIEYKEIAEFIEIKPSSFYSWLDGQYEFNDERKRKLDFVLDTLQE